jgi:glycine cleavage system H protein
MLGEIVECGFEVQAGELVRTGQIIGWIEGFKATSDLYCVVNGEFQQENPDLQTKIELLHRDPYGKGWLYAVRGSPDADSVSVHGYVDILDSTIDRIQGKQN